MKITESQLRSIVRKELNDVLNEGFMDTVSKGIQTVKSAVGLGPENYYRLIAEMVAIGIVTSKYPEYFKGKDLRTLQIGLQTFVAVIQQDILKKSLETYSDDVQNSGLTPEEKALAQTVDPKTKQTNRLGQVLEQTLTPDKLPGRLKNKVSDEMSINQALVDIYSSIENDEEISPLTNKIVNNTDALLAFNKHYLKGKK